MASLQSRAYIAARGDYYLCPMSEKQVSAEELQGYVAEVRAKGEALSPIYRDQGAGEPELIAEGFAREVELTAEGEGEKVSWAERRLVIRSVSVAKAEEQKLQGRLKKAKEAVMELNERGRGKRRYPDRESMSQAAEAILQRYEVQDLLAVRYTEQVWERRVRGYRGQSARVQVDKEVKVDVHVQEDRLREVIEGVGFRVYGTNTPRQRLPLSEAVWAYRSEYWIERNFGRLKGKPLSLTPMYLERDDHATGLIRLLSIGLRVLTLLEFEVRRRLAAEGDQLTGLYAGNPKRSTAQPTSELLLSAFKEITLTMWRQAGQWFYHVTPLSELQQRTLDLLSFQPDIYNRLGVYSFKPT